MKCATTVTKKGTYTVNLQLFTGRKKNLPPLLDIPIPRYTDKPEEELIDLV